MTEQNTLDNSKPWEFKPCQYHELENKTRTHLGDEYWEKNKEQLIDKWKQSVDLENMRVKILEILSQKSNATIATIKAVLSDKDRMEILKTLAVMKYQNLIISKDDNILISELGKEYLTYM